MVFRRFRRFPRRRFGRRKFQKKNVFGKKTFPRVMLKNPMSAALRLPMPPIFRTVMTANIYGQIALGAAASQQYTVRGNCCFSPFGTVNALPTPGFTTPTVVDIRPAGFSRFMATPNNLYTTCRVLASKIEVEFTPTNGADDGVLVIAPVFTTLYGNAFSASQGPYSKSHTCTVQGQAGTNRVHSYLTTSRAYSSTRENVLGSDNFTHPYNGAPVNSWYWNITYSTNDGGITIGAVAYNVRIQYYCQFEDAANTTLPDN